MSIKLKKFKSLYRRQRAHICIDLSKADLDKGHSLDLGLIVDSLATKLLSQWPNMSNRYKSQVCSLYIIMGVLFVTSNSQFVLGARSQLQDKFLDGV